MERKIGEVFEYNGEWYQCVKGDICADYAFVKKHCNDSPLFKVIIGNCNYRKDATSVIFKKLEKVGEPFSCNYYGENRLIMMQEYNLFNLDDVTNEDKIPMYITDYNHKRIAIEIKQNKENMSNTETLWYGPDKKEAKSLKLSNLKPFSLEAAKAGKPVCTRDGRKARIICFDAKFPKTGNIVTLVEKENGEEVILYHYDDGHCSIGRGYDLMMLPEKKEGWVNVYYDRIDGITFSKHPYPSKEEAIKNVGTMSNRIDTVKISWEE